jgi:hypothetical protein
VRSDQARGSLSDGGCGTFANTHENWDDKLVDPMHDSLPDADAVLAQFNRLIQELLRGNMHRNTFRPWEIELLLDIETCNLRESSKRETLRRYQRAVQRHMEKGGRAPLKLSEYLESVKAKRGAVSVSSVETAR